MPFGELRYYAVVSWPLKVLALGPRWEGWASPEELWYLASHGANVIIKNWGYV